MESSINVILKHPKPISTCTKVSPCSLFSATKCAMMSVYRSESFYSVINGIYVKVETSFLKSSLYSFVVIYF